ncbi:hypothetical protein [Amorphus orientalis]|uniref:Transmembrane protein (PGPGW) n=1 Tax=Amorphus orientalis TaxID=649198 RepID=A0AAE3VLP9_9HYPH|nr:hypothetical protein [Amorphus orientalis]MDQ0314357.1 hypothetical protein [Amorphus orientalis]
MRKIALQTLAYVCLILGLLTVWTPIPTGLPLLAVGLFLLVASNRAAKQKLRAVRSSYPRIDRGIEWVEARAHRSMAVTLKRTRPFRAKAKAKIGSITPLPASGGEKPPGTL